mmetsp:Transcript_10917/g.29262  ORF Transcript_10917/g.29262 Transcript_10917/m.29262 type:complete len:619 (+) Transcript_10917:201-2057(+)
MHIGAWVSVALLLAAGATQQALAIDFVDSVASFEWIATPDDVSSVSYRSTGMVASDDGSFVIVLGTADGRDKSRAMGTQEPDDQIASPNRNTRDDIVIIKRSLSKNSPDWVRRTGSYLDDTAHAAVIAEGFLWIVGGVGSVAGQTAGGNHDAFLMKYTLDGERVGTWLWGGTGDDEAYDVSYGAGRLYIVGSAKSALTDQSMGSLQDAFVICFDIAQGQATKIEQSATSFDDRAMRVQFKDNFVWVGVEWNRAVEDLTSGSVSKVQLAQWSLKKYSPLALEELSVYRPSTGSTQDYLTGLALDDNGGAFLCGFTIIKSAYTREDFMVRHFNGNDGISPEWKVVVDSKVNSQELYGGRDKIAACMVNSAGNLVTLGESTGNINGQPGAEYDYSHVVMVLDPNGETLFTKQSLPSTSSGANPAGDSAPSAFALVGNRMVFVGSERNAYNRMSITIGGLQLPQVAMTPVAITSPAPEAPPEAAPTAAPPQASQTETPSQSAPTEAPVGAPTESPQTGNDQSTGETTEGQSGNDGLTQGESTTGDTAPEGSGGGGVSIALIGAAVGGVAALIVAVAVIVVVVRRRRAAVDDSMPADGLVRRRTTGKMDAIDLERGRNSAMPM